MNAKSFAVAALAAVVSLSSASTFAFAQGGGAADRLQHFTKPVRQDDAAKPAPVATRTVSMKREVAVPAARKAQPALVWDGNDNNG